MSEHKLSKHDLQKTILMLNLSVAQIETTLTEGEFSVDDLVESFQFMSEQLMDIKGLAQDNHSEIFEKSGEVGNQVSNAIIAFQFYDKLSQRLAHVSKSLDALASIVSNNMAAASEEDWAKLETEVRADSSMEEEAELIRMVLDEGKTPKEAIEAMKQRIIERRNAAPVEVDDDDDFLF